ncbi:Fic family protein [Bdellovibrionales bacterium]|nr:Fic family protein [Bdellovibrionales bacterium]
MERVISENSTTDGLCLVPQSSTSSLRNALSKALKQGLVKRLAPRVYVDTTADANGVIVNNIFSIVATLYPGAIISHRSAVETGLDVSKKHIVITHDKEGDRALGEITIHAIKGPAPLSSDMPFVSGLYISSHPRSWLECLQTRRKSHNFSKTLSLDEMENILEQRVSLVGQEKFKKMIDELHEIAEEFSWKKEAERFQKIAGAMLGTRSTDRLRTEKARARQMGLAYDSQREVIFTELVKQLRQQPKGLKREIELTRDEWSVLCFFEAYFSNYIEGTKFSVEEAEKIVFEEKIPSNRPEGHDILGTYKMLFPMAIAPSKILELNSAEEFEDEICRLHLEVMRAHPEKNPGRYKETANRVGALEFVSPDLVKGTLHRGFEYLGALTSPLQKALFLKFLIVEVHPFNDGNGRVARLILNRELHRTQQWPILIPTVYRIDYRGGLRALSLSHNANAYIKVMRKAQKISSLLDCSSFVKSRKQLESYRAFEEDESITFNWSLLERVIR